MNRNRISLDQNEQDSTVILINILVPQKCIHRLKLFSDQHISLLNRIFSGEEKMFLYNGITLDPTQTFESYTISSNDTIIALPAIQDEFNSERRSWLQISQDSSMFAAIQCAINPSTSRESARLRDLHAIRIESRRRPCSTPIPEYYQTHPTPKFPPTIVSPPPTKYSVDPLPAVW